MILKEAFTMQNFLAGLERSAIQFLNYEDNVMETKEMHFRKKSNPNDEDEEIIRQHSSEMEPNKVIDLLMDIHNERTKLFNAISNAKSKCEKDLDILIATNKDRQQIISSLDRVSQCRSRETTTTGRGYLINQAGDQTPYTYDIKLVSTINFDRNSVKGIIKRLRRESTETSALIDKINITVEVDYTPKYEIGETFEDIYETFKN